MVETFFGFQIGSKFLTTCQAYARGRQWLGPDGTYADQETDGRDCKIFVHVNSPLICEPMSSPSRVISMADDTLPNNAAQGRVHNRPFFTAQPNRAPTHDSSKSVQHPTSKSVSNFPKCIGSAKLGAMKTAVEAIFVYKASRYNRRFLQMGLHDLWPLP